MSLRNSSAFAGRSSKSTPKPRAKLASKRRPSLPVVDAPDGKPPTTGALAAKMRELRAEDPAGYETMLKLIGALNTAKQPQRAAVGDRDCGPAVAVLNRAFESSAKDPSLPGHVFAEITGLGEYYEFRPWSRESLIDLLIAYLRLAPADEFAESIERAADENAWLDEFEREPSTVSTETEGPEGAELDREWARLGHALQAFNCDAFRGVLAVLRAMLEMPEHAGGAA